MKTKLVLPLFCAIILTSLTLSLSGCNSNEDGNTTSAPEKVIFNEDEQALIVTLESFNNELLQSDYYRSQQQVTRTISRWFRRVCAIAYADVLGAASGAGFGTLVGLIIPGGTAVGGIIGGLVAGASSSINAYVKDKKDYNDAKPTSLSFDLNKIYSDPYYVYQTMGSVSASEIQSVIENAKVNVEFLKENPEYNEIGALHNIAIKKLGVASYEYQEKSETRIIGGDSVEKKIITNSQFITEYKKTLDYIVYCLNEFDKVYDSNGYIKPNINFNTLSPTAAEIMNLFQKLYIVYPDNTDDVDFIINFYANEIAKSKALSAADMDAMFSALSVAAYSPRLWIEELGLIE